jgi:type I restriction enzyme M protein
MASVRDLLNRGWAVFRRAGIADDLTIIEHVAALLLQTGDAASDSELIPRLPTAHVGLDTAEISWLLSEAADAAGSPARLFDRHVLFRLPRMLPGGRYPTPRHIVRTMLRLADVKPEHRLADFACGSGGFLVHRETSDAESTAQTTGVEISPEWARLARGNAMLHGLAARIETGNALQVCSGTGPLAHETFERIIMNPAFGEKVDPGLAIIVLDFQTGSRSETALTALALNKLAPGGRAAILVPSGFLFSNSTGERELRRRLVDTLALEAVLSFPREAFQPYSTLQTHLILVRNQTPGEHHQTWFFQTEYDGYPAGRGRDLTGPPTGPSDLPLVEGVIASQGTDHDETFGEAEQPLIGIKKVSDNASLPGVVIEALPDAILTTVERFPATNETPAFLLVDGRTQDNARYVCVQINLDSGEAHEVPNRDELVQRLYKPRRQDPSPGTTLFRGESPAQAIAVSSDGRLLGTAVPISVLHSRAYDLRPEHYVKTPEETITAESPAALLAAIRRNQRTFMQHVDSLMGRLELTPVADQTLPSPLLTLDGKAVEPFGNLSNDQKKVWERVRKQVHKVRDAESSYDTTLLFTPEDVMQSGETEVSETTRSTLDLLERMGLIVPVTVTDPNTGEAMAFYRRVTERDRWQPAPGDAEDERV